MSVIVFIAAYGLFAFSVLRGRGVYPGYLLGLLFFMTVQFGPHTALLPGYLRLSPITGDNSVNDAYCYFMASFYGITGTTLLLFKRSLFSANLDAFEPRPISRRGMRWAYGIAAVTLLLAIALQRGITITVENLRVLFGLSAYSYTEVRRTLFVGTSWFAFANLMRFTVVPALFGIFCLQAMLTHKQKERVLCWTLAVLVLLFVSIQVNKFYFVYFTAMLGAIFLMARSRSVPRTSWNSVVKWLPRISIAVIIFMTGVYFLYQIQYREALVAGLVSIRELRDTLIFRVFFASSDALRLWIDYFYFGENYAGLSTINKLCALTSECINANTLIPQIYVGEELTTMQVGFIGTALSSVGALGVPLVSMFVLFLLALNARVQTLFKKSVVLIPISAHMFFNAFFLTTLEMNTAMLSGGAVSVPLFYWAYWRLGRPGQRPRNSNVRGA